MVKFSSILCVFFILIFLSWGVSDYEITILLNFMSICKEGFMQFNLGSGFGGLTSFFLFMVFTVVCFVSWYSGSYMEHYNNPKFVMLLFSFFMSMLILSLSSSHIVLMMGWDGLGITSILLIMFYPNMNTLYNSVLTMFFNRLGDVLMIFVLGISLFSFSLNSLTLEIWFVSCLILSLCSFSKSAQFPLSSWLPAAMSAPTPISAMVHSSTLVTAGVFVLMFFFFNFMQTGIISLVLLFSLLTFIVGGISANLEKDMKKIVAFSTMSQISMIFCFVSLGFFLLGCFHMIFHAFFKTMLFCVSGLLFMTKFSDQLKKHLTPFSYDLPMLYFFLLSLFGMTGLIFSSSFFSKDRLLESIFNLDGFFPLLIFFLGSILTLFYCCSLMESFVSGGLQLSSDYHKRSSSFNFFLFSLSILMLPMVLCPSLSEYSPLLNSFSCFLFVLIFLISISYKSSQLKGLSSSFSFFISGMKIFSYSAFNFFFKNSDFSGSLSSSDFFMKNENFAMVLPPLKSGFSDSKGLVYMAFLIAFLLLMFT